MLVISDQQEVALLWVHGLTQHSIAAVAFVVRSAEDQIPPLAPYALIVMDMNHDDQKALHLCRSTRATFMGPILLFSYARDERFHVEVYHAGVDESITKPVGISLAIAKVSSWLRRALASPVHRYESQLANPHLANRYEGSHNGFDFDQTRRVLRTPEGRVARLSKLEVRLLTFLIDNRGRTVESNRIIGQVWKGGGEMHESLLKNLVYRLRRKIEPDPAQPRYIRTVPGQGYCFAAEGGLTFRDEILSSPSGGLLSTGRSLRF